MKYLFLFCFFISFYFNGCTFVIVPCLRNYSDESVRISIVTHNAKNDFSTNYICYEKKVLAIHDIVKFDYKDSLKVNQNNDTTISLTIPAASTAMLSPIFTSNYKRSIKFDVIIKQSEISDTLHLQLKNKKFICLNKKGKNKVKKIREMFWKIYYYDIVK